MNSEPPFADPPQREVPHDIRGEAPRRPAVGLHMAGETIGAERRMAMACREVDAGAGVARACRAVARRG